MTFSHNSRAQLVVSHPSQRLKGIIQNDFWLRVVGHRFLWGAWESGTAVEGAGESDGGHAGYFMTSPLSVLGQEKILDRWPHYDVVNDPRSFEIVRSREGWRP
jgi:hypothetical protein